MRHRRLTKCVLLGVCFLLGVEPLFGQVADAGRATPPREVIATAVSVTTEAPAPAAAPSPATPPAPLVQPRTPPTRAPMSGAIQQASFVPEQPSEAPSSAPAAPATPPMLPPSALLGTMRSSNVTASPPTKPAEPAGATGATGAAAVAVEVVGPDRVTMGASLTHEIVIRNTGGQPLAELHVEEPLPVGVRPLKTDPQAVTKDSRLTWDLRSLEVGGERRLKVELHPGNTSELDLRPYVTFLGGAGLRTRVARPAFSVEMTADQEKIPRGGKVRFTIQVANHGDSAISNIHLYDQLPPGLHHPQGPKIGTERFTLLPGETRTISLETTGVEAGTFRNEVSAFADRGAEARAVRDVVVTEPCMTLRLEGPKQTVSQREVEFHLEATNPGSLPARNARLIQALPPTFEVVSASPGASLDSKQHALVWSLADLTGGQRQTVTFRVRTTLGGDWPLVAVVMSDNLPEARASHTLHAEAMAALKLEVRAREERLTVGEETVFRVHVFNKGDAPGVGLRLTAQLPDALTPLDAQGPSAGQVEKQNVSFVPLTQLEAHGDVVYRIRVRGRVAGKGSLRVELTAEKQPPVQSEISIQVHGEQHAAAEKTTPEAIKTAAHSAAR